MVHVCKCEHHGWEHAVGTGGCRVRMKIKHPTDKKQKDIEVTCQCTRFRPGITLAEYMEKAHAA